MWRFVAIATIASIARAVEENWWVADLRLELNITGPIDDTEGVTLVAPYSLDRLYMLPQQCSNWPSTIVATVYIPLHQGRVYLPSSQPQSLSAYKSLPLALSNPHNVDVATVLSALKQLHQDLQGSADGGKVIPAYRRHSREEDPASTMRGQALHSNTAATGSMAHMLPDFPGDYQLRGTLPVRASSSAADQGAGQDGTTLTAQSRLLLEADAQHMPGSNAHRAAKSVPAGSSKAVQQQERSALSGVAPEHQPAEHERLFGLDATLPTISRDSPPSQASKAKLVMLDAGSTSAVSSVRRAAGENGKRAQVGGQQQPGVQWTQLPQQLQTHATDTANATGSQSGRKHSDAVQKASRAHLFGTLHIPTRTRHVRPSCQLQLIVVSEELPSLDDPWYGIPLNSLRNIGLEAVQTEMLVLLDADFIPRPPSFFQQLHQKSSSYRYLSQVMRAGKGLVVLPAVEAARRGTLQQQQVATEALVQVTSKHALAQLWSAGEVEPFQQRNKLHDATDYPKWLNMQPDDRPYPVVYGTNGHNFEPYVLMLKEHVPADGIYDERLRGYWFNKVQGMRYLAHLNFTYYVAPGAWVLHVPHAPRPHIAEERASERFKEISRIFHRDLPQQMQAGQYRPVAMLCSKTQQLARQRSQGSFLDTRRRNRRCPGTT